MTLANLNTLVVDDHHLVRDIMAEQLRLLGIHSIFVASNGADALTVLRDNRINLVLSDLEMPVMNGIELLKAIRASDQWFHIPFLLVTGSADRGQLAEALHHGVSDLLVKPFSPSVFQSRINRALHWKPGPLRRPEAEATPTAETLETATCPPAERSGDAAADVASASQAEGEAHNPC